MLLELVVVGDPAFLLDDGLERQVHLGLALDGVLVVLHELVSGGVAVHHLDEVLKREVVLACHVGVLIHQVVAGVIEQGLGHLGEGRVLHHVVLDVGLLGVFLVGLGEGRAHVLDGLPAARLGVVLLHPVVGELVDTGAGDDGVHALLHLVGDVDRRGGNLNGAVIAQRDVVAGRDVLPVAVVIEVAAEVERRRGDAGGLVRTRAAVRRAHGLSRRGGDRGGGLLLGALRVGILRATAGKGAAGDDAEGKGGGKSRLGKEALHGLSCALRCTRLVGALGE